MAFEVELAFEGLVDRLDGLAQRREQPCARPWGLVFAGLAHQHHPSGAQGVLEVAAVVVLVRDHRLTGAFGHQGWIGPEKVASYRVRPFRFGAPSNVTGQTTGQA
uniref:hypothetical protein n=1 Tax=Lentzea atacamensis TaxID=531938 RepID=UPI001474CAF7|nr:hypothetical protein [Lentzea atacamensis]